MLLPHVGVAFPRTQDTQCLAIIGSLFPASRSPAVDVDVGYMADGTDDLGSTLTSVVDGAVEDHQPDGDADDDPGLRNAAAVMSFQLLQNAGSGIGFYLNGHTLLPLSGRHGSLVQVWLLGGLALVSAALFVVADRKFSAKKTPASSPS